jgi:hypothetical protein
MDVVDKVDEMDVVDEGEIWQLVNSKEQLAISWQLDWFNKYCAARNRRNTRPL